jgi:cytoskeletal protein CcmA (bactofilin family)
MFDKPQKSVSDNSTPPAPRKAEFGASSSTGSTTIGSSISIKGEIIGEEDLVIQGVISGTINLKSNNLTIGDRGRIEANAFAKSIKVEGQLDGDLRAEERITVTKSGKITGNMSAPRVVLEDGATFKGSIDMTSNTDVSKAAPLKKVTIAGGSGS